MLVRSPDLRAWGVILRWRIFLPASLPPRSLPSLPLPTDQDDSQEWLPLGPAEERELWEECCSSLACSGNAVASPSGLSPLRAQGSAPFILPTQADLEKLPPQGGLVS